MLVVLVVLIGVSMWGHSFRKKPKQIIKYSPYILIISLILIVISLGALFFKGLNWGLDFTGGTILEIKVPAQVTQAQLLETVTKDLGPGFQEPQVQKQESADADNLSAAIIRMGKKVEGQNRQVEQLSNEEILGLMVKLKADLGDNVTQIKAESIGPVIGSELSQKALLAVFLAMLFQLIYITFRFGNNLRYGLAADIALFHDLIIMVGIYALFGKQVDSPFVAAILTVIGYSVMDSIVIFDRIRENLKILKANYEETVNISLNETMTRSVNTLLTVLLCLFALYFFGGATLKNFAFALLIGCASGAYSSVFVASPIVVWIDKWSKQSEERRVAARRAELESLAKAKQTAKAAPKGNGNMETANYPYPSKGKKTGKKAQG